MTECDRIRLERDVYQHFAGEVIDVMCKYEIYTLAKLDKVLMEQRIW